MVKNGIETNTIIGMFTAHSLPKNDPKGNFNCKLYCKLYVNVRLLLMPTGSVTLIPESLSGIHGSFNWIPLCNQYFLLILSQSLQLSEKQWHCFHNAS